MVYEPRGEVLLEMLQGVAPADDGRLGARPPGHVGELERDVSRTDEREAGRQLVELEEIGAREKMLLAGNREASRLRP